MTVRHFVIEQHTGVLLAAGWRLRVMPAIARRAGEAGTRSAA